ncbi:MAG: TonB-dependent receptor [Thermoanaerobaculia bacterium]
MKRRIAVALTALALTIAPYAFGQGKTGSIAGTVVDGSGGAVPGVTVTVTSPALLGSRTAVTNSEGEYLIQPLPPGVYDVLTELGGFASMRRPGVEVRVGQSASVNFQLSLAEVSETIIVSGEPPVIDVRNTSRNFTVDAEAISMIPISTSQQYTDLWVVTPGVRDSLATFQSTRRAPSINGASVSQNKVYVDGIDAGDHVNAGTTTLLNQAVIQEVAISTGGFEAQWGFGSGGMMNIVTRSGGNDLHGGASLVLMPESFNDTNIPGTQPEDVETVFPEVHLGGPIRHDRLWFFVSEKYLEESAGVFNVDDYRTELSSHEAYGKLTWQPAPTHHFTATYQHDRRTEDPSFGHMRFTYDATPVGKFGGYMTGVNWDHQVSDDSLVSLLVSYFDKPNSTDGRNGQDPRTMYADASGRFHTFDGNYDRDQTNEQTRPYISGSFTKNLTFHGSHDVRVSTEWYPRTRRLNRLRMNEVRMYRDSPEFGPRQLWMVRTPRPLGEVENDAIDRGIAFALQDSWRPARRLTVNAGIRYESNHTTIDGRDEDLLDYESWSPRLGLAYQLDDKTVVKASASRIGEKFALDFAFAFFPNKVIFDTATSSQVNGVLDVFTEGAPSAPTSRRNVSRPVPSVWEYVLSVQRQLPGKIALDVSLVDREYGNFVEQIDRNLILDIPNKKFVGRVDPRFDALIDYVDTDRVHRSYQAVQIWLNRRFADRWQLNASYTYAINKEEGEFGYGTTANAALQFAYGDRASEFFEEQTGGRHNFKLSGSYSFPWGINAGLYYSKFSDSILYDTHRVLPPGTLAPRVTLSNGRVVSDPLFNPVLLVAPPSEKVGRRIGGTDLFNLQIQKIFTFGEQEFSVTALVYNLPNSATYTRYGSSDVDSPSYDRVFGAQRPRAGQLSFGWSF